MKSSILYPNQSTTHNPKNTNNFIAKPDDRSAGSLVRVGSKQSLSLKYGISLISGKLGTLLIAVIMLLGNSVSGQTLTTDKDDYAPLSNAVFSGTGFTPNEVVTLKVKNLNQPCNTQSSDSSYAPFTVTTDANGSFTTNWTVCNCPGDSLRLKATGQTSGLILYAYFTDASLRYSVASGNWNSTSTWSLTSGGASGASVPTDVDDVVIERGYNVTVNTGSAVANSLQIGSTVAGNGNGTVTFNSGSQLAVDKAVTLGNGTRTGSLNFTSGGHLKIGINGGGDLVVTAIGTFTPGTGTIEYGEGGNQTAATTAALGAAYNNVTLSNSGTKTIAGVTVNGTMSMEGAATVSVAPTYGPGAKLQYNTTIARTTGAEWVSPFAASGGVVIASSGIITLGAAKTFNAGIPLTVNSGATLNSAALSNTFGTGSVITINGTFQTSLAAGFSGSVSTAIKSTNSPTITLGSNSVIEYNGTAQTVSPVTHSNIKLSGSGIKSMTGVSATGDLTLSGTASAVPGSSLSVGGDITIATGTSFIAGAFTHNIGGDWNNSGGTFTNTGSTINFNSTSADQNIYSSVVATFNNLTVNKSGKTLNISGGAGTVVVSGTLTMTSGNINTGTRTLQLGTSTSVVGTLNYTAGNIIGKFTRWFNSTGAKTFPLGSASGSGTSSANGNALVTFVNLTNGSLTASFVSTAPGNTGLPLTESAVTLSKTFPEGYWLFTPANSLASTNYDLELSGIGFTHFQQNANVRLVKRATGGSWTLNGTHAAMSGSVAKRTGLNGFGEFAHASSCPGTDAGPDQTKFSTSSFTMAATLNAGSGLWTLESGAGFITTPSSATTTITGVSSGSSATLRWTQTSGSCVDYDFVTVANASINRTDLPNPYPNIVTAPAGSLVIAMDSLNYRASDHLFNVKTYGLVVKLLNNKIGVRWVIKAGKSHGDADFSANATRVYPSAQSASVRNFKGGPFLIYPADTAGISAVIAAFNAPLTADQKVNVYQLTSATQVDERYRLAQRIKVAILNDGGNAGVHEEYMANAGILIDSNYNVLATAANLDAQCYTFASEAHSSASSEVLDSIRSYCERGGNFLAECLAVNTYENDASGHYQTLNGLTILNLSPAEAYAYPNADLSFGQYLDNFDPTLVGGAEQNWALVNSSFINNGYKIQSFAGSADTLMGQSVSKLNPNSLGHMIFYTGGHSYGGDNSEEDVNGERSYFNAMLTPSVQAQCATLNFDADISVSKSATISEICYAGPGTVTFKVVVEAIGPATNSISALVLHDVLPAGLTYVSSTVSQGSYNSGTGIWSIGTIALNERDSITITASYSSSGAYTNTAYIEKYAYDFDQRNDTSVASVYLNTVTPGSISGAQTFCSPGDPLTFGSVAATGLGNITYQWQSATSSCEGPWTNIPNATSETYDAPGGLTTTTYYRRVAYSTYFTSVCTANSNCIKVTILNNASCSIEGNNNVCPGSTNTFSSTPGMTTYAWSVTGNATISGPSNGSTISVLAGSTCGSSSVSVSATLATCGVNCTQSFDVTDATPPSVNNCAATRNVEGCSTAAITGPAFSLITASSSEAVFENGTNSGNISDNCEIKTVTYKDEASGTCPIVVTRTWTFTDACGNSNSCPQTINVTDHTDPTWTVEPSNSAVECDGSGNTSAYSAWLASFSGSDLCSGPSTVTDNHLTQTFSNGCGETGSITVSFTLTDACGNDITKDATFTIEDKTDPIWTNEPSNKTVECNGSGNTIDLNDWLNSFSGSDACGSAGVTHGPVNFSNGCGETGAATVTFTLTDLCGNDISKDATFTIEDKTDPTWTNEPSNKTAECDGSGNTTELSDWLASFSGSDACSGIAGVTHGAVNFSDGCGATGSATVTFTLTDDCGNDITKDATFTIEDKTDPTWTNEPSNKTAECDGSGNTTELNDWLNSFSGSDACGGAEVTHGPVNFSDGCGATGSATVTFTLTDECGNDITKDATFTIEDKTDPTWTNEPSNKTVECDGSGNTTELNDWLNSFSGSDACGSAGVTHGAVNFSDGCGATGSATVTFTLTDDCGNDITKDATFTIEDKTDPTWTNEPSNKTAECDGSGNTTELNDWLNSFSGSDACGSAGVTHGAVNFSDGCGATGSATVTFTLTDACGNDITKDATFTIEDKTDPTWTNEPSNKTAECDGSGNTTELNDWLASFSGSDACSGIAGVTHGAVNFSDGCGATGSATVTFTLTDDCGNDITKDATFTIEDKTDPTWTNEPSNKTVECDGSGNTTELNDWLASFSGSDACGSAGVTHGAVNFSDGCGETGSATITFTLTDDCGNDITKDATFTIEDKTDPSWTNEPSNKTVECDGSGNTSELNDWLASFSGSDACSGIAGVTHGAVNFSDGCGETGSATVTFTLTDACGNDITKDATFTIEDKTDPTWTNEPSNKTAECDGSGNTTELNDWLNSFSGSDACGSAGVTHGAVNFSDGCGATGSATVTFTLTDDCGNDITKDATFTIEDKTDPTWTNEPSNKTAECDGSGNTTELNDWLNSFSGSDACGGAGVTHGAVNFSDGCGETGSATVTFTLTDACGNDITKDATFTIEDKSDPTWTNEPSNKTAECDGSGNTTELNDWLNSFSGSDACGSAGVTHGAVNFSDGCGATGSATVTFTLTDDCGNDITKDATFTIEDKTDPTWTNEPSNKTAECDGSGNTTELNGWLNSFSGSDACGGAEVTHGPVNFSDGCGATGSATVTFTLTDECGNDITKDATFTIEDKTDPTWTNEPSNKTVECDGSGNTTELNDWLASFSGSDACSGIAGVTHGAVNFSDGCGATGSATVTFTLTDACGNDITKDATFTIEDKSDPTWTNEPSNKTAECDGSGNTTELNDWLNSFSGSDACGSAGVTHGAVNFSDGCGATGSATVTFTLTDDCGNDITKDATFTIEDKTDPTWTNEPSNKTAECDGSGNTTELNDWLNSFSGSDACGGAEVTHGPVNFSDGCGATGSATVTFTLTDECGNDITKDATFTIEDKTDPTWTNEPSNKTVECDGSGNTTELNDWLNSFSGSDACGSAGVTHGAVNFSDGCGATGSATVTFTLTDDCGNDITKDATFTIEDKTDPTWTNEPSNKTVECDGSGNTTELNDWLASFSGSDACSGIAGVTHGAVNFSDGCGATGSATVTFTLTDDCGNDITKDATFTIEDKTDPTWTNEPSNKTAECDGSGNTTELNDWLNSFSGSDACGGAEVTHGPVNFSDGCGATGSATVTFTLTDACGNDITKDATFTIEDKTDPTWTNEPSNKTVECDGSGNTTELNDWLASFSGSDACSGIAGVTHGAVNFSDGCGATGSATVTFTLTDDCGNDITKDATFTIEDKTDPTWTNEPSNKTAECDGSGNTTELNDWLNSFSGSDACGSAGVTHGAVNFSDGCGETGSATVTFTLTDACGNDITKDATFTIEDKTDPTWTNEPSNKTVECDGSGNTTELNDWLNSFSGSDACGSAGVTHGAVNFSDGCGETGSATVTFTLTDDCGNDITKDATFTIEDKTDPSWTNEPSNKTVECDGSGNTTELNDWLASFSGSDACGGAEVTHGPVNFSDGCGATGSATVTFTLTDACGNDITKDATFTIEDKTDPTWTNEPSNKTVECDGSGNTTELNGWLASFSGSDACGSAGVTHGPVNFSDGCGETGSATVTFTLTDDCGNDITKDATFTIEDKTDPSWTNEPSNKTVECDGSGNTTELNDWLNSFSGSDACGSAGVTHGAVNFSDGCGETGSATVTFTLTDDCGNDITKDATFTIEDKTDPSWTNEPSNKTVECDGSGNTTELNGWLASFSGSDACSGIAGVTHGAVNFSDGCGATGSATVTFTLTDDCGNDITKDATFTIEDKTDPTWTNEPSNKTEECDGSGNTTELNDWLNSFSGSDACGGAEVTHGPVNFSDGCGATGSATVTFTLTDACGNDITKDATFTIEDRTDPTWTNEPSNKTAECDGSGNTTELNDWLASFSGSDACSGIAGVTHGAVNFSDGCGETGSATVTFTLTDACGNDITKDVTFTIEDKTDPIWTNEPSNKTVECDGSGNTSELNDWLASFSGSDACGSAGVTHGAVNFSDGCGETGSATVTFTLTDDCGNDITKDATFTIEDRTDPTWTNEPSNKTAECDGSGNTTELNDWLASFSGSDACSGIAGVTHGAVNFSDGCGETGSATVTFTLTDACGNDITKDVTFTIEDKTDPTWTNEPSNKTVECDGSGNTSELNDWLASFSGSDACGSAGVTHGAVNFSDGCGETGSATVTFTLTDDCGNDITKDATFTIQDKTKPLITHCPVDQTIPSNSSCEALVPDFTFDVTASDNCTAAGDLIITQSPVAGTVVGSGITTIVITVEDACDNSATCEAQLIVTNYIEANNDNGGPVNGYAGQTGTLNVFDNDYLDCELVNPDDVKLTETIADPNGYLTLNPNGTVDVAPGTPAGTYTLTYQICEEANPTNCDEAVVTITVNAATIDAVNDNGGPVNGYTGGTGVANVLDNDLLNGSPVNPGEVTLSLYTAEPNGYLVLNPDGSVTVPAGTPAGTYQLTYQICENLNSTNCDQAVVTVEVSPAAIDAVNDNGGPVNGYTGGTGVANVLDNDLLNGSPVNPAEVTLSLYTAEPNGYLVLNPDGSVTVPAGTPAGTYQLTYQICENLNSTNCDQAVVTVEVSPAAIDAVNDNGGPVNGYTGGTGVANVLDNDLLNGSPVNPAEVTLSLYTAEPNGYLVLNPDGSVTVPAGTPAGTYQLTYQICENLNSTNCDQAVVTVEVSPAAIDAVNDNGGPVNGYTGGTGVANVLDNDLLNGSPVNPGEVTLSLYTAEPNGYLVLNPDGSVTVPAGTPAGTYQLTYQICENLNSTNCDQAVVTVEVSPAAIDAVNDNGGPVNGYTGGTGVANVLDNDLLNGSPVNPAEVTLSLYTAEPNGYLVLNPDGSVTVPAGTPAGTYQLTYQICENLNSTNCDQAVVTVEVSPAAIDAVNDNGGPVNGYTGGTGVANVLDNDLLNGSPVNPAEVTLSLYTAEPNGYLVLNPDGSVTVPAGTPAGTYQLTYQICENLNSTNCDQAVVTVEVSPAAIDAVNDNGGPVNGYTGGTGVANVLDNDLLNGSPVNPAEVTLSLYTAEPNGYLVLNPDGSVTVPAGTPAGTYQLTYQICENLNSTNCDQAVVTVEVSPAAIDAVNDNGGPVNGYTGGTGVANVLDNDLLNGSPVNPAEVTLSLYTAEPNGYLVLNPDGSVTVPAGTPAGTYQLTYQICENLNSTNCDQAVVTVEVSPAAIDAVNDNGGPVNGYTGGTGVANVLDNDLLNGSPVNPAEVTLSLYTAEPNGYLVLNPDGSVTVPAGTPAGTYQLTYQICENLNSTNCDQAVVTVEVSPAAIDAVNDNGGPVNGYTGGTGVANVLDNDLLNGSPVNPAEVTLSLYTAEPNGYLVLNPDGSVTVPAGTPAGTYQLTYQICENLNSTNCDQAVVTVEVSPAAIDAVNDNGGPVNGYTGGTGVANVLDNDLLNGSPVNPAEVTLSLYTAEPNGYLVLNPDGSVTVPAGTPAGTYQLTYQICENLNSTNCDQAVVTVEVSPAAIDAVNDNGGPVNGYTGGTGVANVLDNDLLNGSPVNPAEVTLSLYTAEPNGYLVLNPDGSVTVPAGTPAGTYQLTYQICENLNSTNCDQAVVTVEVSPAAIDAVNDNGGPVNGYTGGTGVANVLDNDLLNGSPVNPAEVTLSLYTAEPNGYLVLNPDGSVTVPAGTPAGTYQLTYQICENLNSTNCDQAVVTVEVSPAAIDAVNDNGGPVNGYTGGTGVANVLDNDLLNGSPVNPAEVTLSLYTAEPNGYLVLNPDGSVTVPAGTPAGTYQLTYQICENLNSTNCDQAVVTVEVSPAAIDAVDDDASGSPVNGYNGGTPVPNVLANDLLNGVTATLGTVNLSIVSDPADGVTLNTLTGAVTVTAGTPAGTYYITYRICDKINPTNCDDALVTVVVAAPAIDAIDDAGASVNGYTGGTSFTNVLGNDLLNGVAVIPSEVNLSFVSSTHAGVTLSGSNVVVAAGTPAGNYTLTYKICEILNPSNCDQAVVTVPVAAPAIDAIDDAGASVNGYTGGTSFTNVLGNDLLNGVAVIPSEVNLSFVSSTHAGVTLSGSNVVVAAGTPAGNYTLTYKICDKLNPVTNCDQAVVTVPVAAPVIDAINDAGLSVNGYVGGTSFTNVLGNDLLNGVAVIPSEVNLSFVSSTHAGVTLSGSNVVVAAGTPAGNYTLTYKICDKLNPVTNCDQAVVTVPVTAPSIDAVNDAGSEVNGIVGGTSFFNVLANDLLNGVAVDPSKVTLTQFSSTSAGVSLSGTNVVVAPGTAAGNYILTYQICEILNPSNCDKADVTVPVTAPRLVNIPPVANGDTAYSNNHSAVIITVLSNDTDADGLLVPSSVNIPLSGAFLLPAHGTAVANANGTITYTPANNWFGVDKFIYQVCDNGSPPDFIVGSRCDTAIVTVFTAGKINLTKSASVCQVQQGRNTPVTYTYVVTNNDNFNNASGTIRDDNGTPQNTADDVAVCSWGPLAPHASTTCTKVFIINNSTTNIATAFATFGNNLGTATDTGVAFVRAVGCACTLGYPDNSKLPRSLQVFNESEVLRMGDPGPLTCGNGQAIRLWYNDEHAMTLGVRRVIVKTKTTTVTTDYVVEPTPTSPTCVTNPRVGTTFDSGEQSGNDVAVDGGRPLRPVLYITDLTAANNAASRAGDWQYGGTGISPHRICGTWKAAVRTIDKTRTPNTVTVTPDADPAKNSWNGVPDVPPGGFAGLKNEGYGAECIWNISQLGLIPGHDYRLQFMVHDGDQNKSGGDVGQMCTTLQFGQSPCGGAKMDEEELVQEPEVSDDGSRFAIFPNPATDKLNLSFVSATDGDAHVQMFDMNGKLVAGLYKGKTIQGELNQVSVNMNNYAKGMYIVQYKCNDSVLNKKLVLER